MRINPINTTNSLSSTKTNFKGANRPNGGGGIIVESCSVGPTVANEVSKMASNPTTHGLTAWLSAHAGAVATGVVAFGAAIASAMYLDKEIKKGNLTAEDIETMFDPRMYM